MVRWGRGDLAGPLSDGTGNSSDDGEGGDEESTVIAGNRGEVESEYATIAIPVVLRSRMR